MKTLIIIFLVTLSPYFLTGQILEESYSGAGHTTPSQTPNSKFYLGFSSNDVINYPASYGSLFGYTKSDNGYGYSYQIYKGHTSPELFVRFADFSNGGNNWFPWRRILDSGNDIESIGKLIITGLGDNYLNGNLGIGTTSPVEKLEVKNGNLRLNGYTASSKGSLGHLDFFNSYTSSNVVAARIEGKRDTYSHKDGRISFYTADVDGNLNENMILNREGNLAIGTSITGSHKLSVNGSIRTKEVKVEATPWPDYVFSDTYQLTPLSEVSTYIRENHHLPGIPTAEEVAENGIKLGEMNAKLLEKVEELTLYLIEQNSQLQKQNEKIETVSKENEEMKKEIEILKSKVK